MDANHVTDKACSLIRQLHGTTFGAKEFSGGFMPERCDAVLYNSNGSFMIETKISRSDFLADSKKSFRANPAEGVGLYRYYACPEGLIKPEELPEKWGLIYVHQGNKRARMVKGFGGCIQNGSWPNCEYDRHGCQPIVGLEWNDPSQPRNLYRFDERCLQLEWRYLYALATRLVSGKFPKNIIKGEQSPEALKE